MIEPIVEFQHLKEEDGPWSMDFDGALGKDGAGIGICFRSPVFQPEKVPSNVRVCSYKLDFYSGFKTSVVYYFRLSHQRIHSKNDFLPTFRIPIGIHHEDNVNALIEEEQTIRV